jgi:hypothetical protein
MFFSALGTGIPKVIELIVLGELVEGNILRGSAKVAWCGGTPGKGVSRLLSYIILSFLLIVIVTITPKTREAPLCCQDRQFDIRSPFGLVFLLEMMG